MLATLTAASLALTALAPAVPAETNAPPGRVTVDVVTVNGSGCPAGTSAVAVSPDNTAFTVTYSEFLAQTGVGSTPTDFRKNCQLNLRVNYPQGFTYGIAQADYRGFAHLERGATGLQRAGYYFTGMSPTEHRSHPFRGPLSDNWQTTDRTEVAEIIYAPCGEQRLFNINAELRVNAGTSDPAKTTSFMSMDSTDGSVSTRYQFSWKKCE
ncbi:DUF4360 domain-containing protein [Amycolatopsis suaedae]|uniref:DUF4360 domain-containing protein n=1 Tax=Amycolatopsis suaedae TaxID=2510978 RepID=A0A4Q7J551_9PSEU|nr:DUF4360 domain-containing protein [Amycolatopsis suaedae]RZQ62197.1 DUF4360 domain-containing protein [Amycolatopsis suaedae]